MESTQIEIEVDGITEITVTDKAYLKIGTSKNLRVYNGVVKSGTGGSQAVEAYIFAFRCQHGTDDIARQLHQQFSRIDHPSVMRSLGCSRRDLDHSDYMFVAFPKFDFTFADLLRLGSSATEMGRFSEFLIEIVGDIVKGLEALHEHGFCCPNLRAAHIAIKMENGSPYVKIWNFSPCRSDNMKDMAWVELGRMLLNAACNNGASESLEINDLCRKMIDGKLKGVAILGHCVLQSVQKKFENVLLLWIYVSINCPKQEGQTIQVSKKRYSLAEYLDLGNIYSSRPSHIQKARGGSPPRTLRKLLDEMRDIIEHEIEYMTPDVEISYKEIECGEKISDLEQHFRKSWGKEFLKIQLWASNPLAKL